MYLENTSGEGVQGGTPLFHSGGGGSIPTSPHQLRFAVISYQDAMQFLVEHHYLHRRAPTSWAFGAFFENSLIGALTIGKPASHTLLKGVAGDSNASNVYELNRLCLLDMAPKNSESRFIAWCLRQLPSRLILVSYADSAFNHTGIVYRATGWVQAGTSVPFTDKTLPGLDHRSVPKHLRTNNKNLITVVRSKKHRFVKCLDNDYSKLKWKVTNANGITLTPSPSFLKGPRKPVSTKRPTNQLKLFGDTMTTDALKSARQQVEQLEGEMLQDITEKAQLLGMKLEKDGTIPPAAPKQKRKRRTRAEIETANQGHVT